jgi:hypothetical protein
MPALRLLAAAVIVVTLGACSASPTEPTNLCAKASTSTAKNQSCVANDWVDPHV